jgi:hypothetical protein
VRTWPLKRYLQTMLSTRTVIFDKARSSNDPIQPPSASPASATTSWVKRLNLWSLHTQNFLTNSWY